MRAEPVAMIARPRPTAYPRPRQPLPFHAGDRLSRAEFERRYRAHPEIKKAEWAGDLAVLLAMLQDGLVPPEHAAFASRLSETA